MGGKRLVADGLKLIDRPRIGRSKGLVAGILSETSLVNGEGLVVPPGPEFLAILDTPLGDEAALQPGFEVGLRNVSFAANAENPFQLSSRMRYIPEAVP